MEKNKNIMLTNFVWTAEQLAMIASAIASPGTSWAYPLACVSKYENEGLKLATILAWNLHAEPSSAECTRDIRSSSLNSRKQWREKASSYHPFFRGKPWKESRKRRKQNVPIYKFERLARRNAPANRHKESKKKLDTNESSSEPHKLLTCRAPRRPRVLRMCRIK